MDTIGQVLDDIPGVVTTGFSGAVRLFDMGIAVQTARAWLSDNLSDIVNNQHRPVLAKLTSG